MSHLPFKKTYDYGHFQKRKQIKNKKKKKKRKKIYIFVINRKRHETNSNKDHNKYISLIGHFICRYEVLNRKEVIILFLLRKEKKKKEKLFPTFTHTRQLESVSST